MRPLSSTMGTIRTRLSVRFMISSMLSPFLAAMNGLRSEGINGSSKERPASSIRRKSPSVRMPTNCWSGLVMNEVPAGSALMASNTPRRLVSWEQMESRMDQGFRRLETLSNYIQSTVSLEGDAFASKIIVEQ